MAALVLNEPGFSAFDLACMRRALGLAKAAAANGEVPVGAVVADPSLQRVVAEGANAPILNHDPSGHAEIIAMRAAGQALGNYRLTHLTLYVTLEPCAMCAGAIAMARIGTLIYGADDFKGGAVAHGPRLFEQPTIHWRPHVRFGLLADESAVLLKDFFQQRRKPG